MESQMEVGFILSKISMCIRAKRRDWGGRKKTEKRSVESAKASPFNQRTKGTGRKMHLGVFSARCSRFSSIKNWAMKITEENK